MAPVREFDPVLCPRPYPQSPQTREAKMYVVTRFKKAKMIEFDGTFRVGLMWHFEPNMPFVATRREAWENAANFLRTYPNNKWINPRDRTIGT